MEPKKRKFRSLQRKARHLSIKEGSFSAISITTRLSYMTPFAVAINSSNYIISLISAIGGLLGPLSQLKSSRLIEKYPRKKIVSTAVFFESILWIPFIILAFLFYKGILTSSLPLLLLIVFAVYIIVYSISNPAWFSWMGDIVDEKYRGKWFSKRNYIIGMVTLVFAILAAFFLDFFKRNNWTMIGFMILFSVAGITRLISSYLFKKSYEPKLKLKKGHYFSLKDFIKKAPKNNFGRFTIFVTFMYFAMSIASPLFAVYMLRNLNLSYVMFMTITLSQSLFSLLTIRFWGDFADRYGNYKVIQITSFLIPFYPILWLLSSNPVYLIFGPALLGGIVFAGFNLSAVNFVYDSVRPDKRGLAVSYFNVLNGFGIFLGAGLGAILVKYLSINFMDKLLFIFIISAFARMSVSLIFIPFIKEIRKTETFDSKKALREILPRRIRMPSLPTFEGIPQLLIKKVYSHRKN